MMLAASSPNFFPNHQTHPPTTVIPYPYYDVNLMVHSPGPLYPGGPYQQNAYLLSEFGNYGPYTPSPSSGFPSPISPTGGQAPLPMPLGMAGAPPMVPRPPLPEPTIKIPPFLPQTLPMPLSPPMTLALPPSASVPVMVQPQGYPPGPPPPAPPPPPPRTYVAQPPDDQFLYSVFQRVNRDKSGNISASELQSALSNGTWKPFNPETIRMMIGMFDKQKRGKINFEEFCKLWKYVTDWLHCFQTYDLNESGNIDQDELKVALSNFEPQSGSDFFAK